LPTIRSRCQVIRFRPLDPELVADILTANRLIDNDEEARRLARCSQGSVQRALDLADPELWSFRGQFLRALAGSRLDNVALARPLAALVDAAGKEASSRRQRLRQIISFATDFYRQLPRAAGMEMEADPALRGAVDLAQPHWGQRMEAAARAAEVCVTAIEDVERNANQAALLECWLDDLAAVVAQGR
jgi:DNA polymerase-3 subunit delta'